MVSFDNTEIAFKSKSNSSLERAYLLFKTIASKTLVNIGNRLVKLAVKTSLPMAWAIKPTVYKHFVGGESITDCAKTVKQLAQYNVRAVLDYSVEGTKTTAGIEAALNETLRGIENAKDNDNIPFVVFKPTGLTTEHILKKADNKENLTETEQAEAQRFKERVETLCKASAKAGIRLLVDAEDACFQAFIDETVDEMSAIYNKTRVVVYNTLQMYRHDRLNFLKEAYTKATNQNYLLGMKLVRGAYMEKERKRAQENNYPSPIHPTKAATDQAFNNALKFCVEHIDRIEIFNGTHNEKSSLYLTKLMAKHQLENNDDRIWFSQLYGMSDHISFNLAYAGYNVAKYLPYGPVKNVLPYLLRRVEENSSVSDQSSRELNLIKKEIKRRRRAQKNC